jgi:manganese-dependent inorganic pyrophosphatase
MKPVLVVGHRNPDTDSIAAAIAYAWMLAEEHDGNVVAARAGPPNAQTAWLLQRVGVDAPMLVTDVAPRFEDVTTRLDTVLPDDPVERAWKVLHETGTVAPVVDAQGIPQGLITPHSIFGQLRALLAGSPDPHHESLGALLDLSCKAAADTTAPTFATNTRIREGVARVLRDEHDDFCVVDEQGRYVGVCRKPDLLNPPRARVVLVDHNGADQSVGSLDEAELLDVLDHHRLENLPTRLPIRFHIEAVGSTCTLVWRRMRAWGRMPPPRIAALLLGGLCSDTLALRSPTATEKDRMAAKDLAVLAFGEGSPLAGGDLESFGRELLMAGAGLDAKDPADVVRTDLKVYTSGSLRFGAAQVEVVDEGDLASHVPPLESALGELCQEQGFSFALLMITDVVAGSSLILAHDAPPALEELPYHRRPDGSWHAAGVVSRKKQLLPTVLGLLER